MSRFNWWRRSKKQAPLQKKEALKGKSFLLQQIEHGDFDRSDYYKQAKDELRLLKEEQNKLTKSWKAGPESLKHKLEDIERKYIKRHNKLMEDDLAEEQRLLRHLKDSFVKEFGVDCWNESLHTNPDQNLITLYHTYKKLADKQRN